MIVNQVWVIPGGMGVEFTFRYFLSVAAWHSDFIPMGAKVDNIKGSGADRKDLPGCLIVFGLQDD